MKTLVLLFLVLAPAWALAQERPRPPSNTRTRADATLHDKLSRHRLVGRVWVGESAPDFDLTSSSGRDITLSSLRGDWLLIRFADHREEFAEYALAKNELDLMGVRLLAICSDKPQTLRSFIQRTSLPFEILSDASGEVSAIYGFYEPVTRSTSTGLVLVDRGGIVRFALQGGAPADQVVELTRFTLTSFAPRP
jgi:peroxiredoxin